MCSSQCERPCQFEISEKGSLRLLGPGPQYSSLGLVILSKRLFALHHDSQIRVHKVIML